MLNSSKVIIWGMGITGQACADYLSQEEKDLILIDRKDPALWIDGKNYKSNVMTIAEDQVNFEYFLKFEIDYILVSPGVDLRKGLWPKLKSHGFKILGDIEFVYLHTKRPIIAVTGTNGKSTTVNMIKTGLELAGKNVFLGGNWGVPAFYALKKDQHLSYDWLILETSSFQLELTKTFTPKIAVITNISMSHAERYDDFNQYFRAKMHLVQNGPDIPSHVIVPKKQHELFYDLLDSTAKIVNYFDVKDLELFDFSKVKVLGTHNYENFAATYHVLKAAGVENLESIMQDLIDQFSGIPHRLERVASWNDVYFYNDSKSTNIEATKTALKSFNQYLPHHPIVLVLGGKLRSEDVSFLKELKNFQKISLVLAFGEAKDQIKNELTGFIKVEVFPQLSEIMQFMKLHLNADPTQKLIFLFSPCFPSFDQFKNFEHRGEVFKMEVKNLISILPSGH